MSRRYWPYSGIRCSWESVLSWRLRCIRFCYYRPLCKNIDPAKSALYNWKFEKSHCCRYPFLALDCLRIWIFLWYYLKHRTRLLAWSRKWFRRKHLQPYFHFFQNGNPPLCRSYPWIPEKDAIWFCEKRVFVSSVRSGRQFCLRVDLFDIEWIELKEVEMGR